MAFQLLLADDSATMRKAVEYTFVGQEYVVTAVHDGASALRAAQEKPVDLAIIDVNMPDMDGYAVCAQLKRTPATASIPVILLGTLQKDKAQQCGANGHVAKPFATQTMLAEVRRVLAPADHVATTAFQHPPPAAAKRPSAQIHHHAPIRVPVAAAPSIEKTPALLQETLVGSIPELPLPDELRAAGLDHALLMAMAREIIERVARETVPKMAEAILREHIQHTVHK